MTESIPSFEFKEFCSKSGSRYFVWEKCTESDHGYKMYCSNCGGYFLKYDYWINAHLVVSVCNDERLCSNCIPGSSLQKLQGSHWKIPSNPDDNILRHCQYIRYDGKVCGERSYYKNDGYCDTHRCG